MIDLKFPRTTIVDKPVPKNAFYKHLEVNAKMKQHFVDDVVSIHWHYKLAPSTINVEDGKLVHEIVVFSAVLKDKDCPDDVFLSKPPPCPARASHRASMLCPSSISNS